MPKILHVISGLKVGGAEMMLLRLIESSNDGPYKHIVVSLTPEGAMRKRYEDIGAKLFVLDVQKRPINSFFKLAKKIRHDRPDIVQTWLYHADLLGGLAATIVGNRNIIWGIRRTKLASNRGAGLVQKICAWLSFFIPKRIVCVAESARITHVAAGYCSQRMLVIPNGFHLPDATSSKQQGELIRAECGFPMDAIVIGSLGRFCDEKDHQVFIAAVSVLMKKNLQVRALMVGRDVEPRNKQLMGLIADSGLQDRFSLLGERRDISACLGAMDIFCLHSRTEGFPNVLGEAMAHALPCVATDVGDAAILLGDTGSVVPKESSSVLSEALEAMASMTSEQRGVLGRMARSRINSEFSMQNARQRFENLYISLLKKESN